MNTNTFFHSYDGKYDEKTPEIGFVLNKDKKPVACINRQPIVTQSQMGQLSIQHIFCSTNCPFANISKNDAGEFVYNIDCKSKNLSLVLKNIAEIEKVFAPKEEKSQV